MATDLLTSKLSSGRLYQWKIAADGKWEEACDLPPSPSVEEINSLVNWIADGPEDIAIEPFFKNPDGTFFFFGVRIQKLDAAAKVKFLHEILSVSNEGGNFYKVSTKIRDALNAPDLFSGTPDFLEVGAQGFWKSYGYYKIWDRVSKTKVATLDEIAENASQILQPFKTSMMLEYAWNAPFASWIAVQISKKSNEIFEFSPEVYSRLTLPFSKQT